MKKGAQSEAEEEEEDEEEKQEQKDGEEGKVLSGGPEIMRESV